MKLPESDLLDAELLETALRLPNQVGGAPVRGPLAWARTREARLGGDQQSPIRMKRLANQLLRHIGAVAVGRVDEVDAQFGEPAQRGERRVPVGRWPPDAGTGDTHGAVAETV